ncbi:hypothetical protein KCU71_g10291, partial [Aureobasidium melanogenum]
MSSAPISSRPRRRPRPRVVPCPRPTAPATPLAPSDYEWLWCDNHEKITQWFLNKSLSTYEEFYISFINFANTAWETSHRENHAPLETLAKFVVELLKKEHIPADELLAVLEDYSVGPWKKRRQYETKGLVKLHPGLNVHDLTYGKTKLQQKVMAYHRKAKNQLRVARLQTAKTATMADQQPLPTFAAPSSLSAPSLGSMLVFDNLSTTLSVPIQIGSLPFVGGKKIIKGDDMDVDE